MKTILYLIMIFFLTSCTSVSYEVPKASEEPVLEKIVVTGSRIHTIPSPPPPGIYPLVGYPAPTDIPKTTVSSPEFTILVRDYLLPEHPVHKNVYANFILFSRKASNEAEEKVYQAICKKWISLFPDFKEIKRVKVPPSIRFIPFIWLLEEESNSKDCNELLSNYDYARAKILLIEFGLNHNKNFIICKIPEGIVSMKIDDLIHDDDVGQAFTAWQNNMSTVKSEPGVVRVHDLYSSVKAVLGALGTLVSFKT